MVYEITTIVLLSIFATIMPSLSKELDVSGNFKVAGLFKLHSSSENGECDILNVDEFLKMERMLYEIDLLNQRQNPPGITLGAKIVDTCGMDVSDVITNLFQPTVCEQPLCDNLLGIITAPSTEKNQILSHLPFAIPVVEFSETCPVVGSSYEWPVYCISSVPGRPTQFEAMLELVQSYDWNYLSVVYQDNEYGWKSLNALEKEARDRGVCIATSLKVPVLENDDVLVDDMYDEIVERLRYQSNAATGVIVILDEPSTVLLMGTAQRKVYKSSFNTE
ncbi:metabotropic glutamate receptor 4-like [Glandiceps talaboti]